MYGAESGYSMAEDKLLHLSSRKGQGVTIHYACWTRAGADSHGRVKQNQDGYIVKEYLGGERNCFFGVYDGHGSDGAKVSSHLVSALPHFLTNCKAFKAREYMEVFKSQMPLCNEHLGTMPHIRTALSGSTAIAAILEDNGLLTVANVGDSRCILGQLRNRQLEVIGLSTDHTPDVPEEVERILSKNGRIKPYMYGGMPVGPKRVWLPNAESPGLSMTRAFGDKVGASVGVTSQPEVRQVALGPEDKYLVFCSDGIFEFMDNEHIMSIVDRQAKSGWSPSDIAKCLVAEANRRWVEEEDGIVDDCTIIVCLLDVREPPPLEIPRLPGQLPSIAPTVSVAQAMHSIARKNVANASYQTSRHPVLEASAVQVGK